MGSLGSPTISLLGFQVLEYQDPGRFPIPGSSRRQSRDFYLLNLFYACFFLVHGVSYREPKTNEYIWQHANSLAARQENILPIVTSYRGSTIRSLSRFSSFRRPNCFAYLLVASAVSLSRKLPRPTARGLPTTRGPWSVTHTRGIGHDTHGSI